jgi:hypothetical protein
MHRLRLAWAVGAGEGSLAPCLDRPGYWGVCRPQIWFGYAAWEYSLISPLRIVRRCTRALARSVTGGGAVSTVGGSCRRAW